MKLLIITLTLLLCSCSIPYKVKDIYVHSITTEKYNQEDIINILDDFNSLGYNKAVKYEGSVPIYIKEVEFIGSNGDNETLGQASISLSIRGAACNIKVVNYLSKYVLRLVILHEYLHCLLFDHVDEEGDLMAPVLDFILEENIEKWAKKASEVLSTGKK